MQNNIRGCPRYCVMPAKPRGKPSAPHPRQIVLQAGQYLLVNWLSAHYNAEQKLADKYYLWIKIITEFVGKKLGSAISTPHFARVNRR